MKASYRYSHYQFRLRSGEANAFDRPCDPVPPLLAISTGLHLHSADRNMCSPLLHPVAGAYTSISLLKHNTPNDWQVVAGSGVILRNYRPVSADSQAWPRRIWTAIFPQVVVAYFRAGYTPNDYTSDEEACWAARLKIERSTAIKCPDIGLHLAGTKKIQQVLYNKTVLARCVMCGGSERPGTCFPLVPFCLGLGDGGWVWVLAMVDWFWSWVGTTAICVFLLFSVATCFAPYVPV